MFERFTEKAIKVVTLSQEEAYNSRHSRLCPEHILLGILKEGSGISARFLRTAGLKTETLRDRINEIMEARHNEIISSEVLHFSSAVKRVLKESWDKAQLLGANYITPEHLFLSLLCEDNSSIISLLEEFNIDIERIRESVTRVAGRKEKSSYHPEDSQKFSSFVPKYYSIPSIFEEADSIQVMNAAKEKLSQSPYENLGTEHLLLAMIENKDSYLYTLLENEGLTSQNFVEKLNSINTREYEYDGKDNCQFTPKAYFAINSAYDIAKELGSSTIKPEHILLGILKEKKGLACRILNEMGINGENIYNKIIYPIEKQKPVTLTIIKLAKEEARRLERNKVGTELILLGIMGEGAGIGAKVLKDLGVTLKDARIEVEQMVGCCDPHLEKEVTFTPRVKKILELAWEKAKKFNHPGIASEHLLLAITTEKECIAMKVLENLGVDALEIRQGILKLLNQKNQDAISGLE